MPDPKGPLSEMEASGLRPTMGSTLQLEVNPAHEKPERAPPASPRGKDTADPDDIAFNEDEDDPEDVPNQARMTVAESVQKAFEEFPDAFGRIFALDQRRELASQELAKNMPLINWNPPGTVTLESEVEGQENTMGTIPCWPFPMKDQNVVLCCCEGCLREYDEDGKEDPFKHHACSCWWLSWIALGADPNKITDFETNPDGIERYGKHGYMQPMIDKWDWKLPAFGSKRNFNPWTDYQKGFGKSEPLKRDAFGWCPVNHINGMTWGSNHMLRILYQGPMIMPYVLFLALSSIMIPCLSVGILYGLIPMGNNPGHCSWNNNLAVMFFTNPIGEVAITFCHVLLMVTAVDNDLPWRPFRMYAPLLIVVYFAQVALMGILALTDTYSFYWFALLARFVGMICELVWMSLAQDTVLGFRKSNNRESQGGGTIVDHCCPTKICPKMVERYKAFRKYLITEFLYLIMSGFYIYLISESDANKAYINFAYTVLGNFFRVAFQHITDGMHRDMNFILSFMTVYGYHAMIVVFISPSFGASTGAFLTAALDPLSTIAVALMHQTSIWHRFRAWIKKVYEPVLMSLCCSEKRNTPLAWPLANDYNKDGRGSSTSIPEYRRTKVQYDLIKFIAQIVGYGAFMGIVLFLRFGPNDKNWPYSDEGLKILKTGQSADKYNEWDQDDFYNALIFSSFVVVWLLVWLMIYIKWICVNYAPLEVIIDEFLGMFYREPQKLAAFNLLVSVCLITVVRMYCSWGNVYYLHYTNSEFGTDCDPWTMNTAAGGL